MKKMSKTNREEELQEIRESIGATIDNQGFDYAIMNYGDYIQKLAKGLPNSEELIKSIDEANDALRKVRRELEKHDCLF